jgi:hypothetical protein
MQWADEAADGAEILEKSVTAPEVTESFRPGRRFAWPVCTTPEKMA